MKNIIKIRLCKDWPAGGVMIKRQDLKWKKDLNLFQRQKAGNFLHPSLLLYACHRAALEQVEIAGWNKILSKQKKLNAYFWELLNDLNTAQSEQVIEILTPAQERGCQVSLLMLKNGKAVYDGLIKKEFLWTGANPT
jgi:kynureninase